VFQTVDRVLTLIEHIVHDVLDIVRVQFELLFIASLYLGVAGILAYLEHHESLDYWLTGGALIGAIATLVNRYGATRYRNGNGETQVHTETTVDILPKPPSGATESNPKPCPEAEGKTGE
jgi:hypothetical protein